VTKQYPSLTPELAEQLHAIEPSSDGYCEYRPCRVQLTSGTLVDRVYVVERDAYMDALGVDPEDDPGKSSVSVEDVRRIDESPYRLPAALANKLYAAGECGMGYYIFTVVLRDGTKLPNLTGNAVDFPALTPGVTTSDIHDVFPHVGHDRFRDRPPSAHESNAAYTWCLFARG
jgi:hypothetical protein